MSYYDDDDEDMERGLEIVKHAFNFQTSLVEKNSEQIKRLKKALKDFSEATSFLVDNPELVKELGAAGRKIVTIRTEAKAMAKSHAEFVLKANDVIQALNFRVASMELTMDRFLAEMKGEKNE